MGLFVSDFTLAGLLQTACHLSTRHHPRGSGLMDWCVCGWPFYPAGRDGASNGAFAQAGQVWIIRARVEAPSAYGVFTYRGPINLQSGVRQFWRASNGNLLGRASHQIERGAFGGAADHFEVRS